MATITKENYLKALYFLHQKSDAISLTDLGKTMEVSKPTVNDMVKKLHDRGWIKYEKYKPLKLTDKGRKAAMQIVRKHRLSEMFLVQVMGFGWEEVHDIAEELEHIKADKLFDRMDELMGFPSVDPHGSPIPDKNGNYNKPNYKLLSQVPENSKVVVRALRDSSTEFLLYLNKKGLQLGTEIVTHQIEPFDKSITVSYASYSETTLSSSVSNRLLVEVV
ncbi:MAG: iron (metal) dependent repressor, dtxr family protein [Bacteroidetes bacterium]|nr:MAG: iron (metal) dependent repressor, dtxr family protein [Bacteroidota bacterium]